MGCASSSPLASNGGIIGVAKGAANDAVHAGEEVLNDVKGTINDTVGNVKDAVIGAVHNVGTGLENVIGSNKNDENVDSLIDNKIISKNTSNQLLTESSESPEYRIIPLKDPAKKIEEIKNDVLTTTNGIKDETEKLTDELIKETEDVVENVTENFNNKIDDITKATTKTFNDAQYVIGKSPTHSLDSLKTNSPDPEIEKAMSNIDLNDPPTPKPTILELENLQKFNNETSIETSLAKV